MVTSVPHFNDEQPVVLPDSPEVVVPVAALLVLLQGGLITGDGFIILRDEEQDVWSVCPFSGVRGEHPLGYFSAHVTFCTVRRASIHDVGGFIKKGEIGVLLDILGQDPDRFVVSIDIAGLHGLVLAATECVGATIHARAAGAGCEPPVRTSLMPGHQLVCVDCATIESGSHDPGCQVGIAEALVGAFTPG
ncbi:MAG: hypothetical protein ACK56I_34250, partial [bacterium]